MPEFLEDPSVLTKDKLKNELVANNVTLPAGEQRKEVYVKLYLQHLTSRNRATPEFSSDEERESTPARGRGRPAGRKAAKKTDKPKALEKEEDFDVTDLSDEALKEELIKHGMKPGPILDNTRKIYQQRLLKLKEQGSIVSSNLLTVGSSADSGNQNGNTDSEHYSDNEEDPKIDLTFEKREPLRGRPKSQVTLRNRRTEQNEAAEESDVMPVLNVKRSSRFPPKEFTLDVEELSTSPLNISEETVTETTWTTGASKLGRLQTVSKDSTTVARRTPRKRVVAAEPLPFEDADISETTPVTETIVPSSNQSLAYTTYEHIESRQVVNQVPDSFKHAESLLSVNEFTDFSRRTPRKQLISEKVNTSNLLQYLEAGSLHKRVIDVDIIGCTNSIDLLDTALIEETKDLFEDSVKTSKNTRQLKITKFVTPIKKQRIETTYEKKTERDVLKDMFPHEVSTPTGISASCRRPIKGAAGRPLNPKDFKIEESYSSKYIPKYMPVVETKSEKVKSGRSLPMWIKILLFVFVAAFCFFVYQAMEQNEGNPFSSYITGAPDTPKN
ncbi:thymopoietin isoform X2 [Bombina bombina]|uniref:thymopoietin isoform X2 n=1 Tax=Bombina bombina TaxID=8345 RepID=UPI00235ABD8E|nr:thymopoietin isoform X2 [Bombina bombina]